MMWQRLRASAGAPPPFDRRADVITTDNSSSSFLFAELSALVAVGAVRRAEVGFNSYQSFTLEQ